jgi:hypothetical protein
MWSRNQSKRNQTESSKLQHHGPWFVMDGTLNEWTCICQNLGTGSSSHGCMHGMGHEHWICQKEIHRAQMVIPILEDHQLVGTGCTVTIVILAASPIWNSN